MKIRALMQKLQFPILQYQRLNAIQFLENNIVKIAPSAQCNGTFWRKKWIYKGQNASRKMPFKKWAILQKGMFFKYDLI